MSEIVNSGVQLYLFKLESNMDGETLEEVTTFRMQQDESEWLVDELM